MVMNYIRSLISNTFHTPTSEDMARAKETVEGMIVQNRVAVFSKSHCPFCMEAKRMLSKLGQDASTKTVELDRTTDGSAMQQHLATRIGASRVTVPQIYIDGKLIGGCSELKALHSAGKLEPLLA
ncbi:thioredoxin-like protein [Leucosporidium creatinivorum]|uniref:Thioredoxin-like protein n=1 Tax=Leucosporidium creatinivorum TaxID=106004 RepID=A0A1Y2F8J3_9BASI|nr:thioredoxin-like protein [Leucosporidium creatinivorum]